MDIGKIERNPDAPQAIPAVRSGRDLDREAAERLDEIHQWFTDQYTRRDVVARTTTAAGQELDWVPAESQTDGPLAEPPDPPLDYPQDPDRPTRLMPLADDPEQQGPPGTVPLLRKPLDRIQPAGDLGDYLSKGPYKRRLTAPDDPGFAVPAAAVPAHKYALAVQYATNFGTEGFINTWRPYVQWSNEFSLGQLWVSAGTGVGTNLQTVEVGAQTYKDIYGDWGPHLFIFYTTNNYTASGNNLGGYNRDVDGWVQVATTVFPGMNLAESIAGGDQYDLGIKVSLFAGNWWVRIGNEWMGYYPAGLFSTAGLRNQAGRVDWGGEIVDDIAFHPEPTSTWMGSGAFPAAGWQRAAYMRNLMYQTDAAGTMTNYQGFASATNPNAYQIAADFSGTSTWGSNFFWGGPGGVA
ncbi:neprosin family prolyl endopeptidase [Amycolatopsis sp. NPDC051045]|uniref:neprosin family prolyl endopeptidase n=1 Tax=Amycolatopsis sp. NPDC051045 TaxID=3156922 RepID=UPI0034256B99